MHATKCFIDSDSECSRVYYKEFQGSVPDSNEPLLRLIIPIHDLRGKHLMIKYSGEITFEKVDKFLSDFNKGKAKLEVDIKSEKPPKKIKKMSSLVHLTGEDYLKKIQETKRKGKDSVVFMYRSNLKRDINALKNMNKLAKEMKKLKDFDVEIFAYDVVLNAEMNFRNKMKSLPGINLFKKDYGLNRNSTLLKANRHKEVLLFLNDRLTTDYSSFFISVDH